MNKKLLELLNLISAKKEEVKDLAEKGELDAAEKAKENLAELQRKFNILKDLDVEDGQEIRFVNAAPIPADRIVGGTAIPAATKEKDSLHEFANAVRNLHVTNMIQEGGASGADGGYTVPEDVQTKINQYKESHKSLRSLVTVENVKTNKGSRVYQTRTNLSGFSEVDENGLVQAMEEPKFEQVGYTIKDYAGYLPVSNDLLADSDANIESVIVDWVGRESLVTDTKKILALIAAKEGKALSGVNGIKHEINVTLGSAYRANARIVTNDDGLDYLDTLEDEHGRPYLNPNPTEDNAIKLRVGATTIPVEVYPNADMPSEPVYTLTEDEALADGKTYYARTGSGTTQSPYVYTAVAEPDVSDIAGYYEITKYRIPFTLGDLKEAFRIFDRQQTNLFASSEASVSDGTGKVIYNAFAQRGRLYRADMRADYKVIDSAAFVNGYIEVTAGE